MKSVKFRVDGMSEMCEVWVDGKCVNVGNFWDFDFVHDTPDLLHSLGVKVELEEYEYDNGFEDEEDEE